MCCWGVSGGWLTPPQLCGVVAAGVWSQTKPGALPNPLISCMALGKQVNSMENRFLNVLPSSRLWGLKRMALVKPPCLNRWLLAHCLPCQGLPGKEGFGRRSLGTGGVEEVSSGVRRPSSALGHGSVLIPRLKWYWIFFFFFKKIQGEFVKMNPCGRNFEIVTELHSYHPSSQ